MFKTMCHVVKWWQAIGLGRFDDTVKYRAGISTTIVAAKKPALSTYYEGLNCSFCPIVVDDQLAGFARRLNHFGVFKLASAIGPVVS